MITTDVHPLSEHPTEYVRDLRGCESLEQLQAHVTEWRPFANDAYHVAMAMSEADFSEFFQGLNQESCGKYAGDEFCEKYGYILIPEILLRVSMISEHFYAPFGVTFLRAMENDAIQLIDGIYVWTEESEDEASISN